MGANAANILTIDALSIGLAARRTTSLVDRVSLSIRRGEAVALVGESGSGKSLTALSIMGLLPGAVRVTGGKIGFASKLLGAVDLAREPEGRHRRLRGSEIGMIFQEPMSAFSMVHTVGDQLIEPLRLHAGMSRVRARAHIADLLDRVGIREPKRALDRYPFEFSGGMLQRAMIARAVACSPQLIIADEPTTALDVTVQAQVLDLLAGIQREVGAGMLFVTHDLAVANVVADRLAVLRGGRLVEEGPAAQTLRAPGHAYTRALIDALPRPREDTGTPAAATDPVLDIKGLSVGFAASKGLRRTGMTPVLDDVSLAVERGTILGLVGESGSGKTTLARAALGLVPAQRGTISYRGRDGADHAVRELGGARLKGYWRRAQMVFQSPYASLNPWQTVEQTLVEPLIEHGLAGRGEARERAAGMLERCGLDRDVMNRFPHAFSGGQRQRIAIARALVIEPELLFCDEPLSALDVSTQARIIALLRELRASLNLSVVLITHDLAVTTALCDAVAVMHGGRIVETGPAAAVSRSPQQPYTRRLFAAAPRLELN